MGTALGGQAGEPQHGWHAVSPLPRLERSFRLDLLCACLLCQDSAGIGPALPRGGVEHFAFTTMGACWSSGSPQRPLRYEQDAQAATPTSQVRRAPGGRMVGV